VHEARDSGLERIKQDIKDALAKQEGDPQERRLKPLKVLKAHRRAMDDIYGIKQTLLAQVRKLEAAMKAVGMPRYQCPPEVFVRFVRTMIHPQSGPREPVVYDHELFLSEMVCRKPVDTAERGQFVVSDNRYQGMLWVESWPQDQWWAGILSLNNGKLDDGLSLVDFLGDGVLAVNIRIPHRRDEMEVYVERRLSLTGTSTTDQLDDDAVRNDALTMQAHLKGGGNGAEVSISCKVTGENAYDCESRMRDMQQVFQQLGFATRIEATDALTLWAEQLPGGFDGSIKDGSLRTRPRRDFEAAAIAPIYMSGRGLTKYTHLCFNEHYEPFAFDQFDHPTAYNTAVLAGSGGGKSVRIQDIINDVMRDPQAQVFAIDYGGSFSFTTGLLDEQGFDVALSIKNKDPYNAFGGPVDDCIPLLMDWIPGLVMKEGEEMEPEVRAAMERALRNAYKAKRVGPVAYRDLAALRSKHPGLFIHHARKRFHISYMEPERLKRINELKKGDLANRPYFEILYVVRLRAYDQDGEQREIEEEADIDRAHRERLELDYEHIFTDHDGVHVLTDELASLTNLANDGWLAELDNSYLVLDVQSRRDFEIVRSSGAEILFEEDWLEEQEGRIRAQLVKAHGGNHPQLPRMIEQELANPDVEEYYEQMEGYAFMQQEVVFRDFIRAAKDIEHDGLNGFIERLHQWHSGGIYSDIFDKAGGPDLSRFKMVSWDFKPIMEQEQKFVGALLGAILQRVLIYCNSIHNMGRRKYIVLDEYFKFRERLGKLPARFVNEVGLQARKSGYGLLLGTQYLSHLTEDDLQDHFQHYFIGTQTKKKLSDLQRVFDMTSDQLYVASRAGMNPGRYSDFMLYVPETEQCEITRSVQTPFEYWQRTTHPEERPFRQKLVDKYMVKHGKRPAEAMVLAIKEAAQLYPRGLRGSSEVAI
jgi:hypothetical protein